MILTRSSRKIVPLIASLLILHGLFGAAVLQKLGLVPTGLGFAMAEIVLGISLMLGYRWARWLTIGACFLAVAAAFAVPVLLFLLFGTPKSEALVFWRNVTSGMAAVFGVVGWFGLAYLRSEDGRRAFSGSDAANTKLSPEPSWYVLPPAVVCLLLLMGTYDAGRRIELFIANEETVAPTATSMPLKELRVDFPFDIALLDICRAGDKLQVKYTNVGAAPMHGERFGIQLDVGRNDSNWNNRHDLDVPPPGVSAWTPIYHMTRDVDRRGDEVSAVARSYRISAGQPSWDNDRIVRRFIVGSPSDSCPDVSTGS